MTYVMSDIHGKYEKYAEMLKKIEFSKDDELIVVGDIVDRGEKPIEVLRDMMSRENVTPIIGNHDLVALTVLPQLYEAILNGGEIDEKLKETLNIWLDDGGNTTANGFCGLSSDNERLEILDYLDEFLPYEAIDIEEKTFVMVHAGLGNFRPDKKFREYTEEELLFSRPEPNERYFENEDIIVIVGHTPTLTITGKAEILKSEGKIFIDCGACYPSGRLACLCLETMEEFYV